MKLLVNFAYYNRICVFNPLRILYIQIKKAGIKKSSAL